MSYNTYILYRSKGLCGQCGKPCPPRRARCDACNAKLRSYKKPQTEEQRKAHAIYMKNYYITHKSKMYVLALKTRYGVTLEKATQLAEQTTKGACDICGATLGEKARKRRLFVDHDHKTGKVRGVLCNKCNFLIALASDNPKRLELAISYLRRSDKRGSNEQANTKSQTEGRDHRPLKR